MINWKLRIMNKATLTALIVATVAFVYQVLAIIGIAPAVSENDIISFCGIVVNILVAFGVIVDPTTSGISDSYQALGYDEPRSDGVNNG